MRAGTPLVTLQGTKGIETAKAVQFTLSEEAYPDLADSGVSMVQWFPYSQIDKIMEEYLIVSQWIVDQKQLSEYV